MIFPDESGVRDVEGPPEIQIKVFEGSFDDESTQIRPHDYVGLQGYYVCELAMQPSHTVIPEPAAVRLMELGEHVAMPYICWGRFRRGGYDFVELALFAQVPRKDDLIAYLPVAVWAYGPPGLAAHLSTLEDMRSGAERFLDAAMQRLWSSSVRRQSIAWFLGLATFGVVVVEPLYNLEWQTGLLGSLIVGAVVALAHDLLRRKLPLPHRA